MFCLLDQATLGINLGAASKCIKCVNCSGELHLYMINVWSSQSAHLEYEHYKVSLKGQYLIYHQTRSYHQPCSSVFGIP